MTQRTCTWCRRDQPLSEFSPRKCGRGGLSSWCRSCTRTRRAENRDRINAERREIYVNWDDTRKAYFRDRTRAYRAKHRERLIAEMLRNYRAIRKTVLERYGGKCECCGESHPEFLNIDHVNGDGRQDRARLGGSTGIYRLLARTPERIHGYRLLCANCNFSRGLHGYCPHERAPAPTTFAADFARGSL